MSIFCFSASCKSGNQSVSNSKFHNYQEWITRFVHQSMKHWMNERMNEWINKWMNEWMNELNDDFINSVQMWKTSPITFMQINVEKVQIWKIFAIFGPLSPWEGPFRGCKPSFFSMCSTPPLNDSVWGDYWALDCH